MKDTDTSRDDLAAMTAEIASAYVANNRVPQADLPDLIASIHRSLSLLGSPERAPEPAALVPAVSIRKSVTPDYIICLEDGKSFKSLKRHIAVRYGLTPDEYRRKWGLPSDYPMVAATYAARRSELALNLGLGRKKAEPVVEPARKAGRGRNAN
ncbi:MucR family transcriptional regulator [Aureimonas sp. SA4125]|nr:MucR family transcriptional regulator [Aureimonas sp. SA4125]